MQPCHTILQWILELLGHNCPFLHELFHNQSQQLAQLQMANNTLEDCHGFPDQHLRCSSHGHVSHSAGHPNEHADCEPFIQRFQSSWAADFLMEAGTSWNSLSIYPYFHPQCNSTCSQSNGWKSCMPFLYAQRNRQIWAENETKMVLSHTSMFSTLAVLPAGIERTFGDPDLERMAHAQLHALKIMMGITADEYTVHSQVRAALGTARDYSLPAPKFIPIKLAMNHTDQSN